MGKPAYLHRQRWVDKKEDLRFIEYCRGLRQKDRRRKTDLAIYRYGRDDSYAMGHVHNLLKLTYFTMLDGEAKIFGPVRCKLRACFNCGSPLSPWGPDDEIQNCPTCGSTAWMQIGTAYYWYVTTSPKEKMDVLRRFGINADGNLRRLFGGFEFPNIRQNIVKAIGLPMRDMLLGYPQLQEATKELMPPFIVCPDCGANVPQDSKFCKECGAKLQ